jgi:error-prone DNA polymerase
MYIELHTHSNFSLLDGADHPETLVAQAAELGMSALALTDHDNVYGAVRFWQAAQEAGIRPIFGVELTVGGWTAVALEDDKTSAGDAEPYHLTLLVENEAGWHNLCYLISAAQRDQPKGQAVLPPEELIGCTGGLIALSGCRQGAIARLLRQGRRRQAIRAAHHYRDLFGSDNFWIELQHHYRPGDDYLVSQLAGLAGYLGLGCVATNNVHYAQPEQSRLQDVLVCIRQQTTLDAAAHLLRGNAEFYLKTAAQMAALFADYPQALANSSLIADRCRFELAYGLQDLPHFPTPGGLSDLAYLRRLCQKALCERYNSSPLPDPDLRERLDHELAIIERAGLANYFLIVADMVAFARRQGIRCQGRGSAANSLVAYLLHISPIDPLAHGLVFERFLSDERRVVPDIDLDFESERREEVIQYIYQTYGPARVAMACTFVTFRARSAVRDVGKVLGLPPDLVTAAAHSLNGQQAANVTSGQQAPLQLLLDLSQQLEAYPRHLGLHSGGMVVTGRPLNSRVPTEPAALAERVVVQWDKEALAAVGLVKIDVLGLRMLSTLTEAASLIKRATGQAPDLDALSFDDPQVYEMIAQADTLGVFQVESRAQAQMLPKLKPRCFNDLIIAISLIRPGPVQGNMVRPFLRRRAGLEPVTYLHPLLEPALAETLGVILFQEQVLKVARDLAGFTAGQGELLRRALGAKRAEAAIRQFQADFLAGAQRKGVPPDVAEQVFDQLAAFGSYSFAKSHAAAFAVIVYQSAWLKRYHFEAYYAALLNTRPGFWPPSILVNEVQRRGGTVLGVDIHHSQANCTLEGKAIRLGLTYVKGLGEAPIEQIVACRQERPFTNLTDFCRRTGIGRRLVERLILAGGMDKWGVPRRRLVWQLGTLSYKEEGLALPDDPTELTLPPLSQAEQLLAEQSVMGVSTGPHVLSFYRTWLDANDILDSHELAETPHGRRVRVAGLLVVHQSPPTAKGFHFLTLETETGLVNVIVCPAVYRQYSPLLRTAQLLLVAGVVQQEEGVTNVLAGHMGRLDA